MAADVPFSDEALYFVPLGGSEQFGVNLNAYICHGEVLAVDCGIGFADENLPGIDILLPDPSFLEERHDDLKGLIITHAHEDHIGAVPYLWKRLGCPIYATVFTAAILEEKFKEAKLKNVPIHIVEPGDVVQIGSYEVQFVPVTHSVPGTCSLIIETLEGRVVHSGDWNLDPAPIVDSPTDSAPFKAAGEAGVLAYIGDSTNAEFVKRKAYEQDVEIGLEKEFAKCGGKIAVTIFSSNVGRMISVARAAQKNGRQVGLVGRSLHRMAGAARNCGYMDDIPEFVSEEELGYLPDDKVVMICTGSQGEYRSALAKISRGEHPNVSLNPGDTVIFSALAIPTNIKSINAMKNNLIAAKVKVVSSSDTENFIHVSGHPYQDEIAEMLGWVKPDVLIPVHGEHTQLEAQARFAESCQIPKVIVPKNGSVIKIAPGEPELVDHVETNILAVDLKRIIPADHQSIVGRRKLQYTGAVHVSLAIDAKGRVLGSPQLQMIGLIDENDQAEIQIAENLQAEVLDIIEDMSWDERMDEHFMSEELRIGVRRFVFHVLGVKPKATIHVLRV